MNDKVAPAGNKNNKHNNNNKENIAVTKLQDLTIQHLTSKLCEPSDTLYGRGIKLCHLTDSSQLAQLKHETTDGALRIIFGVAYCHKKLQNVQPFAATFYNEKDKQKSTKLSKDYQNQGYDCVSSDLTTHETVYWTAGSVYPVCCMDMKLHVPCSICGEFFKFDEGFFCSKKHFICWKECFGAYVKSAGEPGAMGQYLDAYGNLRCPECKESYNLQAVAINGPPNAFQDLMDLKTKIAKDKAVNEAIDAEQKRLTEEFQRIQRITNLEDREAELMRLDIINDILTLRCPRCKLAFLDYDGCAAVSCGCGCGFCGYCLQDCGSDAHTHAATHGNIFLTQPDFNRIQNERRGRLVQTKLQTVTPAIRNKVTNLLRRELEDLNIRI